MGGVGEVEDPAPEARTVVETVGVPRQPEEAGPGGRASKKAQRIVRETISKIRNASFE